MDIADRAEQECDAFLAEARRKVPPPQMPVGDVGDCDWCGEFFTRLIGGACGRCRDQRGLR